MPPVFDSRDVSVGPTLGVSSPPPPLPLPLPPPQAEDKQPQAAVATAVVVVVPCLSRFLKRDGDGRAKRDIHPTADESEIKPETSSESSSIYVPSDSDEDEQEVESKSNGSLGSLGSLEEALPIKRGFSNYFSGKSKSFAKLSDLSTVTQIVKPENLVNKRRRLMIAKWSKKKAEKRTT